MSQNQVIRKPKTRLSPKKRGMKVTSEVTVSNTCDQAWEVITDYDRLDEYMPNLKSRVVGRTNAGLLVKQSCQSSLLPAVYFKLELEFVRESPELLRFRRIEGNLGRFDGYWNVTKEPNGTRIVHKVRIEHNFLVPQIVLNSIVVKDFELIMPSIVKELRRRQW